MGRRLKVTDPHAARKVPKSPCVRVHPEVAAHALLLAGTDPTRIRVVSSTVVLVVNRGRKNI